MHRLKQLHTAIFLLLFLGLGVNLNSQQINIPRIDQMPDLPQPYHMRDWKRVAQIYDTTVFDVNLEGQYLPLVFFRYETVNYPDHISFGLHTAVGTTSPFSGEAINVIPAVVGASLNGIDKSDQFGHNWALMCQEFFNKRPAENIYLNHPASSSGHDWWYETMPNIFYMQLRALYPELGIFNEQLEVMAMQWYRALEAMDASATPWTVPYMNYRAWRMSTMSPLAGGVPEPEAAGAIAWLMYQTYINTGEDHYRVAAEWALEYLNSLTQNPSYELQLPYGVYAAARMNAETGTNYDTEKMLNWVFDRGPLRGWGTITGNWGGLDCSGLVGEANDQGNDYAFLMNGFQHAAALVPMARYDDRFATAIAKWVLNLANASRLFYAQFMPADAQDNFNWSQMHDPHSVIAYEALKEVKHGKSPYATGDGVEGGWSQTNLMLYGSSHVGYLAALLEPTNVDGILRLDLLKTDFYHAPAFPTFLYFNPYDETMEVHMQLPEGNFDIYDAISNSVILYTQSNQATLNINGKTTVMPVLIPSGSEIVMSGTKSMVNDVVIDYNNGTVLSNHSPRIKSLASRDTLAEINKVVQIYCTAEDIDGDELSYTWWVNGTLAEGHEIFAFQRDTTGVFIISCKVTDSGGLADSTSVKISVVEKIPVAPEIRMIKATPRKAVPGQNIQLTVMATDANMDSLSFIWHDHEGMLIGTDSIVQYQLPGMEGNFEVMCTVTDTDGLFAIERLKLMVREDDNSPAGNLVARYLLNGNASDSSPHQLNGATAGGVGWAENQAGEPNMAACFNGSTANITLPSNTLFNFTQALSITMQFKIISTGAEEQFLISHGSWQNRYKISISDGRIRFTLNTLNGIVDLDSETLPKTGTWYHLAAVYDGNDLELWLDGELDAFTTHSGSIRTTGIQAVVGQQFPGANGFNYNGCMDNLSIFDYGLNPQEIYESQFVAVKEIAINKPLHKLHIYPNPSSGMALHVRMIAKCPQSVTFRIIGHNGQVYGSGVPVYLHNNSYLINIPHNLAKGSYLLQISCPDISETGQFLWSP